MRRRWTVIVALVTVVDFSVTRLRAIFGSDNQAFRPAADELENTGLNPKRVLVEVFASPGAAATVNFLDEHAHPQRGDDAPLPWSHTLTTDDPTQVADLRPCVGVRGRDCPHCV
ncbi:MmpS family transport accessory protein [Mycolicibacterium sediminis]|nr:MmpS family transport accessory protein [Mycolicibacterium sediminis]